MSSVENNIPKGDALSLPKGWVETTLGEVVSKIIDYRGKTPKKLGGDWDINGKYRALSAKSVKTGGLINLEQINRVDVSLYKKWMKDEIQYNDILMTSEAPMGEVLLWKSNEKIVLSQRLFALRSKNNISPEYLYYYFTSRGFQFELKARASGTTVLGIRQTELIKTKVVIPPLEEQKAIAKILTAFDDKIELLQAQNKTLESIAQTIFKEWFGKYQIGDELPDGWRMYQMSELVETVNGYSYKGKELVEESNEALVTLKSFDRNGGFQTRGFKPFKGSPKPIQEVKIGDLVVAHTDLTQDAEVLGNPAFIFDNGGFDKMYITMDLVKVISKHQDISSSFLYYLMKDRAFKGHCIGYSNGTTVLHLSKNAIPEYQVLLPSDFDKVKAFSEIANATTNKISLNIEEIKYLKQTRDTLLPKLMSGQIRVDLSAYEQADEFKEGAL